MDRVECPDCAEMIKEKANVCRFCGWRRTDSHPRIRPPSRRARLSVQPIRKDPTLAALLSLLALGFGHFYTGSGLVGAFLILGGLVWWPISLGFAGMNPLLGLGMGVSYHVFAAYMAYSSALEHNRRKDAAFSQRSRKNRF